MRKQAFIFLLIVVGLPIALTGAYDWYDTRFQRLPVYDRLSPVLEMKGLIDQNNRPVSSDHLKRGISVVDFFFTHCPVICSKLTRSMQRVRQASRNVHLLSFSIDPGRDSVERLRHYVQRHGLDTVNWHFVTGQKPAIYRLARKDFKLVAGDGSEGDRDFIHSERLVLVDAHLQIRGYYNGTDSTSVNRLIHDIKKLEHETTNY